MNTTEGRGRVGRSAPMLEAEGDAGHLGRRELGRVSLAREAPVRLGALSIVPAHRQVAHDDGREEILEPRVMQVLITLARAGGKIISRDDLLTACWPGVVVGEDALNRVIGRLRRLSEGLGAGAFRVETITKVGYRLVLPESRPEIAPLPLPTGPISAPGHRPALAAPGKPSIAVLPFKNLGGDTAKEYLADAISEDIVTALSQWRWFFVIARHSSFTYKDREIDPSRIGDELGVRYVLAGSVRPMGERVRVNVQLIDATDGATVWANRFDRDLINVQVLDDEITQQVVAAIEPAMLWGEGARTARKPMADFSALDCFYRGMWCLNKITDEADVEALNLFREAVRLDPDLSLGHSGVARVLYGRAIYGGSATPMEDMHASHASAQKAINLDPRDACGCFASARRQPLSWRSCRGAQRGASQPGSQSQLRLRAVSARPGADLRRQPRAGHRPHRAQPAAQSL